MQTLGKNESVSTFPPLAYTHSTDNKKYVSKKYHTFHAPDRPTNQKVNFDVISNVMTLLTCVKI